VSCRPNADTACLNQRQLTELNPLGVGSLSHPFNAIFAEGDPSPEATLRRYRIVQDLGSRQITREVDRFSLPMILAMGFRVRSARGTPFRQWSLERLGEYPTKGFSLDDARVARAAESPQRQRQPKDRHPPRTSAGPALIGGAQSPPPPAPQHLRSPASLPSNFFRHPLLHPFPA